MENEDAIWDKFRPFSKRLWGVGIWTSLSPDGRLRFWRGASLVADVSSGILLNERLEFYIGRSGRIGFRNQSGEVFYLEPDPDREYRYDPKKVFDAYPDQETQERYELRMKRWMDGIWKELNAKYPTRIPTEVTPGDGECDEPVVVGWGGKSAPGAGA
jgi:hypothetical protein